MPERAVSTQHSPQPKNGKPSATWIAGRIETLLSHYFQPNADDRVANAAMKDWFDALDPFDAFQIDLACRGYLRDEPRARPTPGAIYQRCVAIRREQHQANATRPSSPEPDREPRVTPQRAAQILAEVGLTENGIASAVTTKQADAPSYSGAKPSAELLDTPIGKAAAAWVRDRT